MITQQRLKQLLRYDPVRGQFTRISATGRHGCHKAGEVVGCLSNHPTQGYILVRLDNDGLLYRAHRLAWLYVHGEWPPADIDHINGNRADNRFSNLRAVTRSQNLQNMRTGKGKSGLLGAHTHKNGRWRSSISVGGVEHKLGWYATAQEAHEAYVRAKEVLHPYRPMA